MTNPRSLFPMRCRVRRAGLPALVAGLAASWFVGTAMAAGCPFPSVAVPEPKSDPGDWEVEGRITAVDAGARTLTINGLPVVIPKDALVSTGHSLGVAFECLVNPQGRVGGGDGPPCFPAATVPEKPRSIVGAGLFASGEITVTPGGAGGGYCATYTAASAHFWRADGLLQGVLTGVDPKVGSLTVNGQRVVMSADPRLPSRAFDAEHRPIVVGDLAGAVGAPITVRGYFLAEEAGGTFVATETELGAVAEEGGSEVGKEVEEADPAPVASVVTGTKAGGKGDAVIVGVARWGKSKGQLHLVGQLKPAGAASVNVFAPGTLGAGGRGCEGKFLTALRTAASQEGAGLFDLGVAFKDGTLKRIDTNPGTVCIVSAGGGALEVAVEAR